MEYARLEHLKNSNSALRLLHADNLPLIASFFYAAFVKLNRRAIPYSELESLLDDSLYELRQVYGADRHPKTARQYLEDWCHPEVAYLRKYYAQSGDDPECDLMPATEKTLEWLRGLLEERRFIGTESRLLILFQLLREFFRLTEDKPENRIAELEREKQRIDAEIAKIASGTVEPLDPTKMKERFYHIEETGRQLLTDFRQIEHNFRSLDREMRERIATSDKMKGNLLDEIFLEHDVIWNSDQGRSFRAFWEFLMSPARQDEFESLTEAAYSREEIKALAPEPFIAQLKSYLLEAGEKVYKTNNQLVEQLRKFLDDQAHSENRRIMELIRSVEKAAIACKGEIATTASFMELSRTAPDLALPMTRGLYVPPLRPVIVDSPEEAGQTTTDLAALYRQFVVDERVLQRNIQKALQTKAQVSLKQLLDDFPPRQGIAEVIGYLNLAARDRKAMILDENAIDSIRVLAARGDATSWQTPRVIFVR